MKDKIKGIFNNKKVLIILGILIVIVIFIITFVNLFVNSTDGKKFSREYESLNNKKSEDGKKYPKVNISNNNVFKYSDVDEIVNLFKNKEHGVVYIGYSTCIYCRTAIQVLHDTAKKTEIDKIYYLNIDSNKDYSKVIEVLEDKFITEDKQIYVPLVLFVVEGTVVSYN